MKKIVIKQYVNNDVVSIKDQVVSDITYRIFVDGCYLGDFRSKREVFISTGALTIGLLEKDFEIVVEPLIV